MNEGMSNRIFFTTSHALNDITHLFLAILAHNIAESQRYLFAYRMANDDVANTNNCRNDGVRDQRNCLMVFSVLYI